MILCVVVGTVKVESVSSTCVFVEKYMEELASLRCSALPQEAERLCPPRGRFTGASSDQALGVWEGGRHKVTTPGGYNYKY